MFLNNSGVNKIVNFTIFYKINIIQDTNQSKINSPKLFPKEQFKLYSFADELITVKAQCSCLPNCDQDNYFVEEISSASFIGTNLNWGLKECPKMRLKRDVVFGFSDLLGKTNSFSYLILLIKTLLYFSLFWWSSWLIYRVQHFELY